MTAKRRKTKIKSKPCKGCAYYRWFNGSNGALGCHYIIDTGEPRGCPPEQCDKRTKKLPSAIGLKLIEDPDRETLQRGKCCGDKERAIFAQGRIAASSSCDASAIPARRGSSAGRGGI